MCCCKCQAAAVRVGPGDDPRDAMAGVNTYMMQHELVLAYEKHRLETQLESMKKQYTSKLTDMQAAYKQVWLQAWAD